MTDEPQLLITPERARWANLGSLAAYNVSLDRLMTDPERWGVDLTIDEFEQLVELGQMLEREGMRAEQFGEATK